MTASHQLLRESSPVTYRTFPCTCASELMKKVPWYRATVLQKNPTTSPCHPAKSHQATPNRMAGTYSCFSSQISSGYLARSGTSSYCVPSFSAVKIHPQCEYQNPKCRGEWI